MKHFAGFVFALLLWLPTSTASAARAWQAEYLNSQVIATQVDSSQVSSSQVSPSPAIPRPTLRILFVGNSLTYVNNVPGMVQAIAEAQQDGPRIETTTFTAPGGRLAERWEDDAAPKALRDGHWDALVLQEASGLPICMASTEHRRDRECRDSERAHKHFAALASQHHVRVLIYATWGPDESWDSGLERGHELLMQVMRGTGAEVALVPATSALRRYASRYSREQTRPDGVHASVSASLVIAALMYRAITGHAALARDTVIDFRLLPANAPMNRSLPLESQAPLAGDGKTMLLKAAALAPLFEVAYAGQ